HLALQPTFALPFNSSQLPQYKEEKKKREEEIRSKNDETSPHLLIPHRLPLPLHYYFSSVTGSSPSSDPEAGACGSIASYSVSIAGTGSISSSQTGACSATISSATGSISSSIRGAPRPCPATKGAKARASQCHRDPRQSRRLQRLHSPP
ncbi:hypothetical protein TorRG33x02_234010, partial [Trema orientale]